MADFSSANVPYPDKITSAKSMRKTKIIEFEAGNDQRFPMWGKRKTSYTLMWNVMKVSDYKKLLTFFDSCMGQVIAWTMTDSRLHNGASTLRFNSDDIAPEYINANFVNLSVEVVTC